MPRTVSKSKEVSKGPGGRTVQKTKTVTKTPRVKKGKKVKDNTKKLRRNADRITRATSRLKGGIAKAKGRQEGGLPSNTKSKNARNRERVNQLEKKKKKLSSSSGGTSSSKSQSPQMR